MIAWAAGGRLECDFAFPFETADFYFDFLRVHDVAALAYAGYRLIWTMGSDSEVAWDGEAFAVTATCVRSQLEFYAVRDRYFPCEANEVAAYYRGKLWLNLCQITGWRIH